MITPRDYYAVLNGADQENGPYSLNKETGLLENSFSDIKDKGNGLVQLPNGQRVSVDRLNYIKENDEIYNKQLSDIMHTISPYFQDSYTSGITGNIFRPIVGLAEGIQQQVGAQALATKGSLTTAPARNLQESRWEEYRKNLSPEKSLKLINFLNKSGGRSTFALSLDANQYIDSVAAKQGVEIDSDDRKALLEYHKLLQTRIKDEQDMMIFQNYNEAFQGKISDWSPNVNSTFQKSLKPVGNVIGSIAVNAALSAVPYVGQVAAMGLAFNQQFYSKRIEALEKGWDLDKANYWAMQQGLAQAALERISLKGLQRAFLTSSRSIRNVVFNYMLPEAFEEGSQSIAESFIDNYTGLNIKTGTEIVRDAAISALLGMIGGGLVGSVDFHSGQIISRIEALQREAEKLELNSNSRKQIEKDIQTLKDIASRMPKPAGMETVSAEGVTTESEVTPMSERKVPGPVVRRKVGEQEVWSSADTMDTLVVEPEGSDVVLKPIEDTTTQKPAQIGYDRKITAEQKEQITDPSRQLESPEVMQARINERNEKAAKIKQFYANLEKVIRENALKQNPNLTEEQLNHLINKAYMVVNDPDFQGSVVAAMYNTVDQMVKRASWANFEAKENILELEELLAKETDSEEFRKRLSKGVNTLLDKEEYKKYKAALEEVSASLKRDFLMLGATEEQADTLVAFYQGLFFETALKSGLTPSQIYKNIRPTILNMNRARLNGQEGVAPSVLDNVRKSKADTDIDTAIIEARQNVLNLRRAVTRRNNEFSDQVNNAIYGTSEKAPSAKQTLNALTNQALAQQQIHEEMGVLENMKEEEWIVFALMKEMGYTESELLAAYGASMPNAETAYNEALQKRFPALNGEELNQLNNVKKQLLKGRDRTKRTGGVYSTEDDSIFVGTDASLSTRFHEGGHYVVYRAIAEAKMRQDAGIDLNTSVDRFVRKVNNAVKKRYGEFPNERQFHETVADLLQDYYVNNKVEDPETAEDLVNAVEESESQSVSNAASLYGELTEKDKTALKKEVSGIIEGDSYRDYAKNIDKAYELQENALSKTPEETLQEIRSILSDKKNPIKDSVALDIRLKQLEANPKQAVIGAYDLALRVASALRKTAAQQFVEKQLDAQDSRSALRADQFNVFKGFYSGAAFLPWDYWKSSEIPLGDRIALSQKAFSDGLSQINYRKNILQLKNWIKRLSFSVYAHAQDFSPALGVVAREAMYKMGKLQQRSYDRVSKFQTLLAAGCKKHGITNEQYWAQFKLPYLQSTEDGYKLAKAFVMKVAGAEGVKAMEDVDAMMHEFAQLLAAAGVEVGTVEYFAPRRIKDYDVFKRHLQQDINHPLSKLISDMRKKGASEEEINNTINACFYNRQKWENHKVTGFQKRRVLAIRPKDLSFYEDPFDAMVSYIDDTARTIMMRELFGYAQKNVFGEEVDFNKIEQDSYETFLEESAMGRAQKLFDSLDKINNKEEAVAFIKKTGMPVKRFLKLYTDFSSIQDATFEGLMVALYDGYAYSKVDEYKQEQTVIDFAKSKTEAFMTDYKRKRADIDLNYGAAGKLIKQAIDSGKKDATEVQAVLDALQSLGKRNRGSISIIEGARVLNTICVIGSKFSSTIANLKELSLCAWRFGLIDTLRAARMSITKGDEFLQEIGLPKLNEAFRPQTDDALKRSLDFIFKYTGFNWADSKTKATIAFSAMNNAVKVLNRGDDGSLEYKRTKLLLDRTFAYSPEYDLDGKMAARRAQVEEDLKNNVMSDDVKFFLFNVVSDQQPINSLEVPVGYNEYGSLGKLCYQFSTVQLKQFEFLSRELYDTWKRNGGPSWELAGRLLSFAAFAALFGVPTEWLRDIIRGQKLKPLHSAAAFAILDFAFVSSYMLMNIKRDGIVSAVVGQYAPGVQIVTDFSKDLVKNVFGKGKLKDMRIFRNAPFFGELWWFWFGGGRKYTVGSDLAYSLEENNIAEDALPVTQWLGSF